ncbi:MAG: ribosome biogenesis GTPase Der [Bacilli bacterium]|nr:ribosome biogenesis GTPase Der [Bacilli bacterium]
MPLGTVAIVGAPSVGKSTIFNRIVGERAAIVSEIPGTTRDRLYSKASWLTKEFTVIDTGGLQIKDAPFQEEIRAQVDLALIESDLIVFVVDGKVGLSGNDRYIAKLLYKTNRPIILAVNKVDNINEISSIGDFYRLGFGDPIATSGAHGIGIGDLLDRIIALLPEREEIDYGNAITFSLVGRPNVGKSSITNYILGEYRQIVSSISGTTRDSIDTPFTYDDKNFVVIDTAGLVKRGKIYEAIDKYSALRALKAIERSEIALFVIDGSTGMIAQDAHVVGYAVEAKKAVVVLVNKWDVEKHGVDDQRKFLELLRANFKFLEYAPVIFVSAKTGKNMEKVLPTIMNVHDAYNRRIPTSILNKIILDAQEMNPTPEFNHGRLKIIYASQVGVEPPTFVLFCNNPAFAHFSYTRYLENRLRESFDFEGTPLNIIYRMRK